MSMAPHSRPPSSGLVLEKNARTSPSGKDGAERGDRRVGPGHRNQPIFGASAGALTLEDDADRLVQDHQIQDERPPLHIV